MFIPRQFLCQFVEHVPCILCRSVTRSDDFSGIGFDNHPMFYFHVALLLCSFPFTYRHWVNGFVFNVPLQFLLFHPERLLYVRYAVHQGICAPAADAHDFRYHVGG
jgi:hypothetical protein